MANQSLGVHMLAWLSCLRSGFLFWQRKTNMRARCFQILEKMVPLSCSHRMPEEPVDASNSNYRAIVACAHESDKSELKSDCFQGATKPIRTASLRSVDRQRHLAMLCPAERLPKSYCTSRTCLFAKLDLRTLVQPRSERNPSKAKHQKDKSRQAHPPPPLTRSQGRKIGCRRS